MKKLRPMLSSEGRGAAISYAPRIAELTLQYKRLNSREARVAFIDVWLRTWAYDFEKTWPVIYQALEWVEEEELYKDPRVMNPDEIYPDFKSFFEARLKKPFTLWIEMEQTHRYVTKFAPDLIEKTWGDARTKAAEHYQQLDDKDQANQEAGKQGQRTDLVREASRPREDLFDPNFVDSNKNNINEVGRPTGTSAAYALRRLRKDRPDIHARVLAGKLTAHGGMLAAGFRKPGASRKLSGLDRLRKAWAKATADERNTFRAEIM
jgi:hypothetical protein